MLSVATLCRLLAALTALCASPLGAQVVLRLQVDNDAMVVGPRHDRDYTHGIDASVGRRRCDEHTCAVTRIGLVHALYTPSLITPLDPPDDRPFAGYLGVRGGIERWSRRGTWQANAIVGLRGPAALGEPLQRFIHQIFSFPTPPSWDRQLPTAPWLALAASGGRWVQAGPLHAGALGHAELGTLSSYLAGGLRLGLGADARWLDPRPVNGVHPGVGLEAGERWFAHDQTLGGIDGGAGVRGVRPWRSWVTGDFTLRAGGWAFTLAMSWLGKDFDGQATAPVEGSASLQWTPK